jgi:hypothetical protein
MSRGVAVCWVTVFVDISVSVSPAAGVTVAVVVRDE